MATTGRLSNEHKKSIPIWKKQGLSSEEIALRINRTINAVNGYLDSIGFVDENNPPLDTDTKNIRTALYQKPYWADLKKQFNDHELRLFVSMWERMMMEQFRYDLLPAEELQVKQMLTLDIFLNRSAAERLKYIRKSERLERELHAEYSKPKEKVNDKKIDSLESRLAFANNAISNHTTEHARLLEKIERIHKDLKATRDQRVKKIEDAKTSFTGLIKALEDEQYRKRMGKEAELMNIAKEKVKEELSEWHEFGKESDYSEIDIPVLNAETVKKHDDI